VPFSESIILVIVGAAIGFIPSTLIERKRQAYGLKREIYFEFIDIMARGERLFYKERWEKDQIEYDPDEPSPELEIWFASLEAVKHKIDLSASNKIKFLIKSEWPDHSLSRFNNIEVFYNKLLPLIKSDLMMKWWQFWK